MSIKKEIEQEFDELLAHQVENLFERRSNLKFSQELYDKLFDAVLVRYLGQPMTHRTIKEMEREIEEFLIKKEALLPGHRVKISTIHDSIDINII